MPKKSSGKALLNPNIKILVQGKALSPELEADFVSAKVSEDIDAPSMFDLKFVTWDIKKQQFTWIDKEVFEVGDTIEIQIGYDNNLLTVIIGEITGLEPEFSQDSTPMLVVRGHDFRHRLLRGRQTRSFKDMKDSDIVSIVAKGKGLTSKVDDTKIKLEYILQHNQTDWEFLQERATRLGYEVAIENKELFFRTPEISEKQLFTITFGDDLQDFYPRLSTMNLVSQVQVQGWIPKDKKAVVMKTGAGKEGNLMAGQTSGAKEVQRAFGNSSDQIVNQSVSSKAEAEQISVGLFQSGLLNYITGEGTCIGYPNLRAGKVIEIAGVGKKFGGLYYLLTVEHSYSATDGYQTAFTVRRNAT